MELFSCCWYSWLHRPAQARNYPTSLMTNFVPNIFFCCIIIFITFFHDASSNGHHIKPISFQGIIFIRIGRCLGFVISTLLLHPNTHVPLLCPSSLSFLTPSFSPASGLLLAFSTCPHSPAQCIFYCKTIDPCVIQSWHLHLHPSITL